MCGIAGVVGDGAPEDEAAVRRMSAALAHRGPDGDGIWRSGPCVLGHRRLSIIDLSSGAAQPLVSEDGSVGAVVNGEIYNFQELRRELVLRGHAFRSATDSEVVVHLYEELGPRCVERLAGMFALAIWDARRRRLVLARDRAGKKPLYVRALPGGGLAFASEVRALLAGHPGLAARPDLAAIDEYLTLQYVPSPRSAYQGIDKLEAAHVGVLDPGKALRSERYWRKPGGAPLRDPMEDLARELLRLVEVAVRKRLTADVPVGAFLSGGLDSSIVVALMARQMGSPLQTFSIGFPDASDSELPYARLVAARFGARAHEETLPRDTEALLRESVRSHGEPFGDSSAVATLCLSRLARRHVKVALSGDGSDEAFGGYARYQAARLAHVHDALPAPLRRVAGRALALAARAVAPHAAGYFAHVEEGEAIRYPYLVGQFTPEEKRVLLEPAFLAASTRATTERFEEHLAASGRPSAIGRLVDLDWASYLVDDIHVKVDIASMAHGLEVRCPFLDTEVVELAARLPGSMLMGLRGKRLLRAVGRRLLPPSVLQRHKRGFGLPLRRWLGPLARLARETLLDRRARARGLFKPRGVAALVAQMGVDPAASDRVWTLLMLELWFREHVDG